MAALAIGLLAAEPLHASDRFLATRLVDMEVVGPQGEALGEIEKLLIDVPAGRVDYLLLEYEKPFALGKKLFAFEPSDFGASANSGKLVLEVEASRLAESRGFYDLRWPAATGTATRDAARIRGDELVGEKVRGADGDALGEVEDLVVDLTTGRIAHVVIDVGGDARDATVPFHALEFTRVGGALRTVLAQRDAARSAKEE